MIVKQGYIAKHDSYDPAIVIQDGDELVVATNSPCGANCVHVITASKKHYRVYIENGVVRTKDNPVDTIKSTIRAKFTCIKSTNRKGTTNMFESCFKVIEGEYKTTNEAYGVLQRLSETRRFRVLDSILASSHKVTVGQRFHIVIINRAMIAFAEVPSPSGILFCQLGLDSKRNVVTEGVPLRSLELVKRHVAILEWVGETIDEVEEKERTGATGFEVFDRGMQRPREMIYTTSFQTPGGVTYRLGFVNKGMEVRVGNADNGRWLEAVVHYIERLSNLNLTSGMIIERITIDGGVFGAIVRGLPGAGMAEEHFYVMSESDGKLRSCAKTNNYYKTGEEMHVMIESYARANAEDAPQAKGRVEWIPIRGQFVILKDDPKKTMYILGDYDQAEHKFILTLADSSRRERLENLQVRGVPAVIMADPSKIRPFVLTY